MSVSDIKQDGMILLGNKYQSVRIYEEEKTNYLHLFKKGGNLGTKCQKTKFYR